MDTFYQVVVAWALVIAPFVLLAFAAVRWGVDSTHSAHPTLEP
jgi:hypothetical protein